MTNPRYLALRAATTRRPLRPLVTRPYFLFLPLHAAVLYPRPRGALYIGLRCAGCRQRCFHLTPLRRVFCWIGHRVFSVEQGLFCWTSVFLELSFRLAFLGLAWPRAASHAYWLKAYVVCSCWVLPLSSILRLTSFQRVCGAQKPCTRTLSFLSLSAVSS